MLVDSLTATYEMERRYESVSEGMQTVRLLERFVAGRFHAYRDRFLQAAANARLSLGAWLQRKHRLDSARS